MPAVLTPPAAFDNQRARARNAAAVRHPPGDPLAGPAVAVQTPPLSSGQSSPREVRGPVVRIARNASFCSLTLPCDAPPDAGGDRAAIAEFSAKSRRELLRLVSSIDRQAVPVGRVRFVTLTYPREFPTARASKSHLDALLKRFERHWGPHGLIWKIEPQKRGAPHFHLLLLVESDTSPAGSADWWARAWADVVGSRDPNHLRWHLGQCGRGNTPCVEVCRDWHGVTTYAGKYLGKLTVQGGDTWEKPGRFWGVRRRDLLPITVDVIQVDHPTAIQIRRTMRRWYERQPSGFIFLRGSHQRRGHRVYARAWVQSAGGEGERAGDVVAALYDRDRWRVQRRRWLRSRGGISLFMPDATMRRILTWAGV